MMEGTPYKNSPYRKFVRVGDMAVDPDEVTHFYTWGKSTRVYLRNEQWFDVRVPVLEVLTLLNRA